MTTANRSMTADELFSLPGDDNRRELVRGELHIMPPAGFEHGAIGARIIGLLTPLVQQRNLGILAGADAGYVLFRDPDTVRAPDVSFVSAERIKQLGIPRRFFPGAPDLAVEVLSPGDTVYELEEKVQDLLAAGTKLIWVVNPRARTLTVYRSAGPLSVLRETDEISGEDVVPGFACPVREIFA